MAFGATTVWQIWGSNQSGGAGNSANGGGMAMTASYGSTPVSYASAVAINAGGTGYSVNDVLTISGGTNLGQAVTCTVTSQSGGVITGISVTNTGGYMTQPANPVSVTGGGGTSATLNMTWTACTDYSKQQTAQLAKTDLASSATLNTNVSSSGGPFTGAMVGNIINVTAGTGFTVQRAQAISFNNATSELVLDKSCGGTSKSGGTYKLGGAVASIDTIATLLVTGNLAWEGNSSDSISAGRSLGTGTVASRVVIRGFISSQTANGGLGDILGASWTSNHNADGSLITTGWPVITMGNNSITGPNWSQFAGLSITCSNTSPAFTGGGNYDFWLCKIVSTGTGASSGCVAAGDLNMIDCDVSHTSVSGTFALTSSDASLDAVRITSTNGSGISVSARRMIFRNCEFFTFAASQICAKNTGANAHVFIDGNTFNGVVGTCINLTGTYSNPSIIISNNQVSNFGTFASTTNIVYGMFFNNSFRVGTGSPGTTYSGFIFNSGIGDITDGGADSEYVNASATPPDLHLVAGAAGLGAGFPPSMDIGAWQRANPTFGHAA